MLCWYFYGKGQINISELTIDVRGWRHKIGAKMYLPAEHLNQGFATPVLKYQSPAKFGCIHAPTEMHPAESIVWITYLACQQVLQSPDH